MAHLLWRNSTEPSSDIGQLFKRGDRAKYDYRSYYRRLRTPHHTATCDISPQGADNNSYRHSTSPTSSFERPQI